MKAIFNHLNHFKSNLKTLTSKLTNFNVPDGSGVNNNNTKRTLAAIEEITKGYKGKSMLWFEKGSAFISSYLNKADLGKIQEINYSELFDKNSYGKTVLASVSIERGFDSESAALITFLKLSTEEIKVVLSKDTAFCCVGSVDKNDQRYSSIVFAKNN
jgi:hypothetical protein